MAKQNNKYKDQWEKENVKRVTIKLNKYKDCEVIYWLSNIDNVNDYVKSLIKKDIESHC